MPIGVQELDLEGLLALPPLLDSKEPAIREGVAALLAERYRQLHREQTRRQEAGWTAFQASDQFALDRFEAVRDKWQPYEADWAKRAAAIKRFYEFAYRWY
jgi:hypothetical protein